MKKERKLFLQPRDNIDQIIKYLKAFKEDKIILVIPKNSILAKKIINFEILKKEIERIKKEVLISSVDEHILEQAALAGFKVLDEFFLIKEKFVTDVVLDESKKILNTKALVNRDKDVLKNEENVEKSLVSIFKKQKKEEKKIPKFLKVLFFFIILLIIFVFCFFYLPKMEVNITLKKNEIEFNKKVKVSANLLEIKENDNFLEFPGELISLNNNIEKRFQATKKENVALKARGKLAVYNAYSSKPQMLVKTTRFLAPTNKIYRLEEDVIIPGAKVESGKIEPAFIVVNVVADEAGEDFNLLNPDPNKKWTIPGFLKSDKYTGFYALANQGPILGGFKGERYIVKEEDLENAKKDLEKDLLTSLNTKFLIKDFHLKTLTDPKIEIVKIDYTNEVDENNNFKVLMEANLTQIAFKEADLKNYLQKKYEAELKNKLNYEVVLDKIDLIYSEPVVDFSNNVLTFNLVAKMLFKPVIDLENFKKDILNLNEQELRNKIYNLRGYETIKINFWPFWVKRSPYFLNRILININ